MNLIGLMLARNEAWVLRASIDAALRWTDKLVVLNHASTDSTRAIAATAANATGRVVIEDWTDGEFWSEMNARQRSLEIARAHGATHIAIIDADEILCHQNLDKVRPWFESLAPGQCLDVPMVAPWKSLDVYSPHTQAALTLGFRDAPHLAWKPRGAEQYHHHCRPPHGSGEHIQRGSRGGAFHLQYAAWRRFNLKHTWYLMTERIRWPQYTVKELNEKYHWWERSPHGTDLTAVPPEWWGDYKRGDIALESPSWHEVECRRLWEKHGEQAFAGLDLFGWRA